MALRAAVKARVIRPDPTAGITPPRVAKSEGKLKLPSPEQVGAALGEAPDGFHAFVAVCVVTVQHAMGHSSASITLNVYRHLWPKAEDRTSAAAANLMATTAEILRTLCRLCADSRRFLSVNQRRLVNCTANS